MKFLLFIFFLKNVAPAWQGKGTEDKIYERNRRKGPVITYDHLHGKCKRIHRWVIIDWH